MSQQSPDKNGASLKARVQEILLAIVNDKEPYRNEAGFTRWGRIQADINAAIDAAFVPSSIATCPCGDILAIQEKKCDRADCPVVAKSPSAIESLTGWLMFTSGDGPWSKICRTEDEVRAFLCEAMYCPVEMADQTAIDAMMDHFRDQDEWAQWTLDWNFEDGGVHAVRLSLAKPAQFDISNGGQKP